MCTAAHNHTAIWKGQKYNEQVQKAQEYTLENGIGTNVRLDWKNRNKYIPNSLVS